MRAIGVLVAASAVLLATACSEERSSADAETEAKVIVRADLRSGSSGADAAALAEEYIGIDTVAGTRGDAGTELLVFMEVSATEEQTREVEERLEAEDAVERVTVERR